MAPAFPPERFGQLVEAATGTFIGRGYRLTQMTDVAAALGVAKGTVYGYVESKEALFDAALRYADGHLPLPEPAQLPLPTPKPQATLTYVRDRLAVEAEGMVLARVVRGSLAIDDPAEELAAVFSDLYRRVARNRFAMKLVDRCAAEFPDLAAVWFGEGRWAQHQLLVKLITAHPKRRRIRRVEQPEVVARTVLETVVFWAMHRHFDPSPQPVDDRVAEKAVIDLLVNGLLETR
jgi:AcrR family transcriptional regulator